MGGGKDYTGFKWREMREKLTEVFWYWLVFGAILIVLECVVPGAILSFLGIAALMISGGYYFGILSSIVSGFLCWFIISLVLVFFLRSFVLRFMPSDSRYQPVDEDDNARGSLAEVVEEIRPGSPGRIRFRGTTWEACAQGHYPLGRRVVIEGREGNAWLVK